MSDAPERIYLQWCDDPDCSESFEQHNVRGDVLWCEDRISDTDIAYVRADLAPSAAPAPAEAPRDPGDVRAGPGRFFDATATAQPAPRRDALVDELLREADVDEREGGFAYGWLRKAAAALAQRSDVPAWIAVADRLPEMDVEVLVYAPNDRYPVSVDEWTELREAPVSWSTQTIPVGYGWREHDDFAQVTHWMPFPSPPSAAMREENGNG